MKFESRIREQLAPDSVSRWMELRRGLKSDLGRVALVQLLGIGNYEQYKIYELARVYKKSFE